MDDSSTLLYRQINPIHLQSGRISSAAFVPGPNHQSLLSTRHERIGAERAYTEFLMAGNETLGSWAVSVGEVEDNGVCEGIQAFLDEHINGAPEGHVSIDFNPSPSSGTTKRVARHLARKADERGRQYPPAS